MSFPVENFIWQEDTPLNLKRFESTRFKSCLPCFIQIIDGYFIDEDVLSFSSGEVYFVSCIGHQPRVLVKDSSNRFLGIPLDYHLLFHETDQTGKDELRPRAESIASIAHRPELVKSNRKFVRLSNSDLVYFRIGKDGRTTRVDGVLEILDVTFEESYLIARGIVDDEFSVRPAVIPVSFPMTVKVCKGLTNTDLTLTELLAKAESKYVELSSLSKRKGDIPLVKEITEFSTDDIYDEDAYSFMTAKLKGILRFSKELPSSFGTEGDQQKHNTDKEEETEHLYDFPIECASLSRGNSDVSLSSTMTSHTADYNASSSSQASSAASLITMLPILRTPPATNSIAPQFSMQSSEGASGGCMSISDETISPGCEGQSSSELPPTVFDRCPVCSPSDSTVKFRFPSLPPPSPSNSQSTSSSFLYTRDSGSRNSGVHGESPCYDSSPPYNIGPDDRGVFSESEILENRQIDQRKNADHASDGSLEMSKGRKKKSKKGLKAFFRYIEKKFRKNNERRKSGSSTAAYSEGDSRDERTKIKKAQQPEVSITVYKKFQTTEAAFEIETFKRRRLARLPLHGSDAAGQAVSASNEVTSSLGHEANIYDVINDAGMAFSPLPPPPLPPTPLKKSTDSYIAPLPVRPDSISSIDSNPYYEVKSDRIAAYSWKKSANTDYADIPGNKQTDYTYVRTPSCETKQEENKIHEYPCLIDKDPEAKKSLDKVNAEMKLALRYKRETALKWIGTGRRKREGNHRQTECRNDQFLEELSKKLEKQRLKSECAEEDKLICASTMTSGQKEHTEIPTIGTSENSFSLFLQEEESELSGAYAIDSGITPKKRTVTLPPRRRCLSEKTVPDPPAYREPLGVRAKYVTSKLTFGMTKQASDESDKRPPFVRYGTLPVLSPKRPSNRPFLRVLEKPKKKCDTMQFHRTDLICSVDELSVSEDATWENISYIVEEKDTSNSSESDNEEANLKNS